MTKEELKKYREALNKIKELQELNISLREKNIELEKENIDLVKSNLELSELAYKDELTSLMNRRALTDADNLYDAVIMCDIDFFKKVNDTYGHNVGDEVLKIVARILNSSIRKNDKSIRWGGEEFLVLLSNCTIDFAYKKAELIRHKIEKESISVGDIKFSVTMSFGVTLSDKNVPLSDIIKKADEALYYSKENGRNQVTRYDRMIKVKKLIKENKSKNSN